MFCAANGIEHVTTSPYHPAGNGLAEKAVGIFKAAMIKMGTKVSLRERVNRFLAKYRTTPHVTTGVAPCELLCGRKLKTHLDLFHPAVQKSVSQHQHAQKRNHDKTAIEREFAVNDSVYVRNFGRGEKWIPGEIVQSTGPVSYKVKTDDGLLVHRHADQIKITCAEPECESISSTRSDRLAPTIQSIPKPVVVGVDESKLVVSKNLETELPCGVTNHSQPNESETASSQGIGSPVQQLLRRSTRRIKPQRN